MIMELCMMRKEAGKKLPHTCNIYHIFIYLYFLLLVGFTYCVRNDIYIYIYIYWMYKKNIYETVRVGIYVPDRMNSL